MGPAIWSLPNRLVGASACEADTKNSQLGHIYDFKNDNCSSSLTLSLEELRKRKSQLI